MAFSDCLKFANENPVCQMATTDGDQPHLRVLVMVTADQKGFWFCTLKEQRLERVRL